MDEQQKRTWAEIHMDRLEKNWGALRHTAAPECRMMALVKANAYGHGAVPVSRRLVELGADYLAVACLDEARELRQAGISAPILILGYTPPQYTDELLSLSLTQTVYDPELAQAFSDAALARGKRLLCHAALDTGMSRLGWLCAPGAEEETLRQLIRLAHLPGLELEGAFTHFAAADCDQAYTRMQFERLEDMLGRLERAGIKFPLCHCAASAAMLNYPCAHLNMVRPGIVLYGHHPDPSTEKLLRLEPVMELKTRVASVKRLPAGTCISYGCTFTLERDSLVAVVPVGYADGLFRLLSNRVEMLVHGRRVRQIGRICMDMCMLDVTDVEDVSAGDVVTVFGRDGDALLPLEEQADILGTIQYELLCAVSPRVPRVYLV